MPSFSALIREHVSNGSVAVKTIAISVLVLVIGAAIYHILPARQAATSDIVNDMQFLYKCSNPKCGNVVELDGKEAIAISQKQIEADVRAGGLGYPANTLPCPKCGHQLVRAERLPSGEVQPLADGTAVQPVLPGMKK